MYIEVNLSIKRETDFQKISEPGSLVEQFVLLFRPPHQNPASLVGTVCANTPPPPTRIRAFGVLWEQFVLLVRPLHQNPGSLVGTVWC